LSNINGPIPDEWAGYVTQTNAGLEVIPHILYDSQLYTSATTTILPFFTSVPANDSVSNVNPPSILPNPASFLIKTIGIFVPNVVETIAEGAGPSTPPGQFNDIVLLCNTGICRLTIGDKPYGPWPMYRLPTSSFPKFAGLAGGGAAAANVVTGYGNTDGPLYPLLPPLLIAPMQKFKVTLEWPAGAVTLAANRTIKVLLDGQLSRGIQ
jgi:hypothetical protein